MKPLVALCLLGLVCTPAASQDTTVVRSNAPGVWRNPRLVEELRIGAVEGDDHYIFGRVSDVEVTSDGSIWVADGQGPRVRIYDRNGRYVRDVYRAGAGPGEIKGIMGIDLTPDRQIAIWDLPNHRVSLYRENGDYVTSFPSISSSWGGESFQVDRAGRFWIFTSVRNPACIRQVTAPDGTVTEVGTEGPGCGRAAYFRYSSKGVLTDTLFIPIPQSSERVPSFVIMLPEGPVQPFVSVWSYALSPEGYIVTAHSSRYAISLVRGSGTSARTSRPVTRIERQYQPVRLSSGEQSEWQARADYYTRRQPGGASAGVKVPDIKPPIRSISVDDDGRVWVDRYVAAVKRPDIAPGPARPDGPPALTWREPRTFDVFESTGKFLGSVVAPIGTLFLVQRGNFIWGVARGEFDENYVVRYRLETD
jgi:hypothetical protein